MQALAELGLGSGLGLQSQAWSLGLSLAPPFSCLTQLPANSPVLRESVHFPSLGSQHLSQGGEKGRHLSGATQA